VWVPIRAEPKPRDLRRSESALETFQMNLGAFPLSQEEAAEVLARLDEAEGAGEG